MHGFHPRAEGWTRVALGSVVDYVVGNQLAEGDDIVQVHVKSFSRRRFVPGRVSCQAERKAASMRARKAGVKRSPWARRKSSTFMAFAGSVTSSFFCTPLSLALR